MDLSNKVAVVTGAGSGIGRAIALRCAEAGGDVAVVDVDESGAADTVTQIEALEQDAIVVPTDVSDDAAAQAMAETIESEFGRADILVNNAGIRIYGPVTEMDEADWDTIVGVNLMGVGLTSKHLIPVMADTGGGSIVNISSNNAVVPRDGMPLYDATKAGVLGLTRAMACDHAHQGIRVNAIMPGATYTDYHEDRFDRDINEMTTPRDDGPGVLKRWAEPREIANAVVFLASDAASYITATDLRVDGGIGAVFYGASPDTK